MERISGKKLSWTYVEDNRIGDHIWWITEVRKFRKHYANWRYKYDLEAILSEIHGALTEKVKPLNTPKTRKGLQSAKHK